MEARIERWEAMEDRFTALHHELQEAVREYAQTIEDVQDRIDRGNKAWRRVRASQRYEEERGEAEEWGDDLPGGNAPGGQEQGVLPLRARVEGLTRHDADWSEKKRLLDRQLAGLE